MKENKAPKKGGCLSFFVKVIEFIGCLAVLCILILMFIPSSDSKTDNQQSATEAVSAEPEIPTRETAIGKSNSPLPESTLSPRNVRNDVTGNWRIVTIADIAQVENFALPYYRKYFKSEKEIHFIVNFTYKTTTKICDYGDCLYVCIYEYVKGEEHDAKILPSGPVLGEYFIHKDNGDIERF